MKKSLHLLAKTGFAFDLTIAAAIIALLVGGVYETSSKALQLLSVSINASGQARTSAPQITFTGGPRTLARN